MSPGNIAVAKIEFLGEFVGSTVFFGKDTTPSHFSV